MAHDHTQPPAVVIVDCYVFRRTPAGVEFLFLKRRPGAYLGDTWHAVHGKIEANETAWQAALRELREEAGLTPARFWQLEFVNTFYAAKWDRVLCCPGFVAEVAADAAVRLSEEHTAYRWIARDEARSAFLWPGQRAAIAEVLAEVVDAGPAERHLRIDVPPASDQTRA